MALNLESPVSQISQTQTSGMLFIILRIHFINFLFLIFQGNPDAPSLVLSQYGRDYLQVSWNLPNDGGCDLVNYQILFSNDSSSWTPVVILPDARRVYVIHFFLLYFFFFNLKFRKRFTHLNLQTSYNFQIIANNLVGASRTNTAQFSTDSGM